MLRSSAYRGRYGTVSRPDSSGRLRAGREGARTTGIKEASSARTYLSSIGAGTNVPDCEQGRRSFQVGAKNIAFNIEMSLGHYLLCCLLLAN